MIPPIGEMNNFAQILQYTAGRLPEKTAIVCNGERWSFARLEEESNRIATALLKRGIRPGDRVALLTPNSVDFISVVFACAKIGAVPVKLNWRLAPEELNYLLGVNECRVLFYRYNNSAWHARLNDMIAHMGLMYVSFDRTERSALCYADLLDEGCAEFEISFMDRSAPLMHLHTSGASGTPKTVVYTHNSFLNQLESCIEGLGFYEDMVFLSMSQMFHSASSGLYSCIAVGATSVVFSRFDPREYLRTIAEEKVTRLSAIPTVLHSLLSQPDLDSFDLSGVRTIGYSAAPMSPALIDRAIERFHCRFMQSYGMTEMGSIVTILRPEDHIKDNYKHLYSVGTPIGGVEIKIIDDRGETLPCNTPGRIAIKGPGMMAGYFRMPDKTAEVFRDGWYISDDMGWLDEEGFLSLSGRVSDLIITGGENVFAQEVENLLMRHKDVEDCAVIGCPDEYWGEMVTAFIVLKAGVTPDTDNIVSFCRENIAGYKVPKKIHFIEALPRNAVGKTDKPGLRKIYCRRA